MAHHADAQYTDTRKQGVIALSLASDCSSLLPPLIGMADDEDVQVRLAVIASLAEVNTKEVTTAPRKALEDPTPEVSFAAANVL